MLQTIEETELKMPSDFRWHLFLVSAGYLPDTIIGAEAIFIIFTIKEMMRLLHLGNNKINKMLKELEAHNLVYRSHQGLGKPNKIYVYDLLKADNDNWLPKQFKYRKGRTNEKEIL